MYVVCNVYVNYFAEDVKAGSITDFVYILLATRVKKAKDIIESFEKGDFISWLSLWFWKVIKDKFMKLR